MQKTIIGLLSVAVVMLGLACAWQAKQLRRAETRAGVADESRAVGAGTDEAQTQRIQELERSNARPEKQVAQFATVTTALRTNESALRSNATALAERIKAVATDTEGEGKGAAWGEMIGKMMKDPAMREMMREQQKVMINMMYGGLFKELNLSPEDKDKFKELLTESQMGKVAATQSLLGGTQDEATTAAAKQSVADAKKQSEADIKALLGEGRYAQYEDYQKNVGERMQLDQLKTQLAGENAPLRDEQTAQLLKIMKEEKLALPPAISPEQSEMPDKNTFTPEKVDEQLKWMAQYNARVTERARTTLTPDQFIYYQKFQEQQASMAKLGMEMARQLFGGEKGKAPAK